MSATQLQWIDKHKIKTVFDEHISDATEKRLKRLKPYLSDYDYIIPVEKDPLRDVYYVVGENSKFHVLYKDKKEVLCKVEAYTSQDEQLLKIGRRFSTLANTSTNAKQQLLDELLLKHKLPSTVVTAQTVLDKKSLKNYTYVETVPTDVQLKNNNSDFPVTRRTINMIYNLDISRLEKDYLLAVAKTRSLTHQQLRAIDTMTKEIREYHFLQFEERKQAINYILSSPALLTKIWKEHLRYILHKRA